MPNRVVARFQPTWNPVTKRVELVDVSRRRDGSTGHARRAGVPQPYGPRPEKRHAALTIAGEAWLLFYRAARAAGFTDEAAQRLAFRAADNAAAGRLRTITSASAAAQTARWEVTG